MSEATTTREWVRVRIETLSERLARYSVRNEASGCLEWTGLRNPQGYGKIGWKGKTFLAHRVAWEAVNGEIPSRLLVLHKCDTPSCIEPSHLFCGTQLENLRDMNAKGRRRVCAGNQNGNAKLTSEIVSECRRLHGDGESITALAARFGVHRYTIKKALDGKTWRARTSAPAADPPQGEPSDTERLDCVLKWASEIVAKIPGGIRCIETRADIDAVLAAHRREREREGRS